MQVVSGDGEQHHLPQRHTTYTGRRSPPRKRSVDPRRLHHRAAGAPGTPPQGTQLRRPPALPTTVYPSTPRGVGARHHRGITEASPPRHSSHRPHSRNPMGKPIWLARGVVIVTNPVTPTRTLLEQSLEWTESHLPGWLSAFRERSALPPPKGGRPKYRIRVSTARASSGGPRPLRAHPWAGFVVDALVYGRGS